jgi:hypothetical protein
MYFAAYYNMNKVIKYLLKRGFNKNHKIPLLNFQLIRTLYQNSIVEEKYDMIKLISDNSIGVTNLDKVYSDVIDVNHLDVFGNNLGHFILLNRLNMKKGYLDFEIEVLKSINNFSDKNKNGQSIDDLIKMQSKPSDYNIKKNNDNIYKLDLLRKPKTEFTKFMADTNSLFIYVIYLLKRYKNLTIPVSHKRTFLDDSNISLVLFHENVIQELQPMWMIFWESRNKYFIHPDLNKYINKVKKERYIFIFLSIYSSKILHANILLYDTKNKTIERFEPYGDTIQIDSGLDELLKNKLTEGTKYKYKPSRLSLSTGLQLIADENNLNNLKKGDFGGFCLAWCIWYAEMRINNDVDDLPIKIMKYMLNNKIKFVDFIRNYSNYLDSYRLSILKENNIDKYYNEHLGSDEDKLIKYFKKFMSKYLI